MSEETSIKQEYPSIYVFKLSTGEEIIGGFTGINEHLFYINEPLTLVTMIDSGIQSKKLIRYSSFIQGQSVCFMKNGIVSFSPANDAMVSYYHLSLELVRRTDKNFHDNIMLAAESLKETINHVIMQESMMVEFENSEDFITKPNFITGTTTRH